MLKYIIAFFIFCIILFLYLHIQFHMKTSDDLEVFEVDQASKERLEEICDLRQPTLFDCDDIDKIISTTNINTLLQHYPVFEVKIRNVKDENDVQLPLPFHMAAKLFQEDKESNYLSEGNNDFLNETGAVKNMSYNDEYLRPFLVSNCYYDLIFGSSQTETPCRYDINYRNYYIVTQGTVKVKLLPPKSSKYLYPINDYELFEFKSPINVWNPQHKYKADFDKVRCLEIELKPGKILYIPAYWWYSFKLNDDASISCFKYRTFMNNIAISPHIFMYALQNQNIERKIARHMDNTDKDNTDKDTETVLHH
jgi:hypothetical protein